MYPPPHRFKTQQVGLKWLAGSVRLLHVSLFLIVLIAGMNQRVMAQSPLYDALPNQYSLGTGNLGLNTGTASARYQNGTVITVTVIDGPDGGLYWFHPNAIGVAPVNRGAQALLFSAMGNTNLVGLKDPDVAMLAWNDNGNQRVVAVIVGVSPVDNHVYAFDVEYDCNEKKFQAPQNVCKLGWAREPILETAPNYHPGSTTILNEPSFKVFNRRCSSPNVDVNRSGQVAIVWAETIEIAYGGDFDQWMIDILGLSGSNATYLTRRGSIMSAEGVLGSGNCYAGVCGNSIGDRTGGYDITGGSSSTNPIPTDTQYGDPVSAWDETDLEVYSYMNPDVCISDAKSPQEPIITYVYTRKPNQPLRNNSKRTLITVQKRFRDCTFRDPRLRRITNSSHEGEIDTWEPVITERYRIAAYRTNQEDHRFMFVGGADGGIFGFCDQTVNAPYGEVLGYGKFDAGNTSLFQGEQLNASANLRPFKQRLPAIAFDMNRNKYLVGWELEFPKSPTEVVLVACTYSSNNPPTKTAPEYSIVNESVADQSLALSVAAPLTLTATGSPINAFSWIRNPVSGTRNLMIRESTIEAGTASLTGLNLVNGRNGFCGEPAEVETPTGPGSYRLRSYPNPSETERTVIVEDNSESNGNYELKNTFGVTVQQGKLEFGAFTPNGKLSPGTYILHIDKAGKRTTTKVIIK